MKVILPFLVLLIVNVAALAQIQVSSKQITYPQKRSIRFNFITKDSLNLSLNENFEMIEDSCAQIIRYCHLDIKKRKFFGKFRDISRVAPGRIITEGGYNEDGLKDGYFTTYYLNGKMQATGSYKNGKYDGAWDIFYDDGKPRLKFTATDNIITVTDYWDAAGKKLVDNGKGNYRITIGALYWKGKLLNGLPDGTWRAIKTDDATETDLVTESYKNGLFKKGSGPTGDYTDAPRMTLVPIYILPFINAEMLHVSMVPCNGTKRKHVVNAQYRNGLNAYSEEIKRVVTPYISTFDIKSFENEIIIDGYVSDRGALTKLSSNSPFREDIARGLISRLIQMASLEPATVDGKPVNQKISFKFTFEKGLYYYSYRLLPVEVN